MSHRRAEALRSQPAQLVAEIRLYSAAEGGKKLPIQPGWGCPCCCRMDVPASGWDGWPLLDAPMAPGESRKVGFVFLSGDEAAAQLRKARTFYLWEGRFIGEAVVIG